MFTIAAREFRCLFQTPLAWAILAVCEFIVAYLFLGQVELFLQLQSQMSALQNSPGVTEFIAVPTFANAAVIILLIIPLLTMRLVSEERRNQTLPLLFSAPVSMLEIVLGKFLGVMGFLAVLVLLILLLPLSLLLGSGLDFGRLWGALFGLVLMISSFSALGLYLSTLCQQPSLAAVLSFGALVLLWIVELAGNFFEQGRLLFEYLSLLQHYQMMLQGIFRSSDLVYYCLFTALFLLLSYRRLDADRLQL
ncbi:MAG: ABC transporter permease subunit [Gammaproteobacteria bacterium]|nr:ABC transporter permease subunit [Gammaproteobacteria bacterium]